MTFLYNNKNNHHNHNSFNSKIKLLILTDNFNIQVNKLGGSVHQQGRDVLVVEGVLGNSNNNSM